MIARALVLFGLLLAAPVLAQGMDRAEVLILGEVHDNPAHHRVESEKVAAFHPAALVFEMLTPAQAARVSEANRGDREALGQALDWADSGWPDFAMYYPIFAAAPQARIYGAEVPRAQARRAMDEGVAAAFGPDAMRYGLTDPLPAAQQAAREALQARVHCGALPGELLPKMVMIQRLRDATLARAVVRAMHDTGGPVAVITGNGHARTDWGVPAVLGRVAPKLRVRSVGQGEGNSPPDGRFDSVIFGPPVAERPDPCAAFR